MALVDEAAGDRTGTCVEVLVAAPDREVAAGVVQREWQVAGRVCKVESDPAALRVRGARDRGEVEGLAAEVLHAGQQHQRDAGAVLVDRAQHVVGGNHAAGFVRIELDPRARGIVAVAADLRVHCVMVRREGRLLDKDRMAFGGRAVEADHHQVQVDRQRIHRDDFLRQRTDQRGEILAHEFVVGHPGVAAAEVRFHREIAPVV